MSWSRDNPLNLPGAAGGPGRYDDPRNMLAGRGMFALPDRPMGGITPGSMQNYLDAERARALPGAPGPAMPGPAPGAAPGATPGAAPGAESRIATRVPYAKGSGDIGHRDASLRVGMDAIAGKPGLLRKHADLVRSYPGIRLAPGMSDADVLEATKQHMVDNLLWLHDNMPQAQRDRAKQWYDGANAIAQRWAQDYGLQPHQAAGVLAALSPQKDWYQNVSLAQRLLDIRRDQQNSKLTPEMEKYARGYIDELSKKGDQDNASYLQSQLEQFRRVPFRAINDPTSRAVWARWYDEAHNPRDYLEVTPEGDFGDTVKTDKGQAQKVGWGSFKEISKALQAADTHDLAGISDLMGQQHKVRNFYNNIIAPNDDSGDVTIDTHAIAAAHMRPLAGKDPEVGAGLGTGGGGAKDAATGSKGLYPLYADAYREAARQRGILPREMQSITWEGVRGLFSPEQKRSKPFKDWINYIWQDYQHGHIDAHQARALVSSLAGGIRKPSWDRSGAGDDAEGEPAADED